MDKPTTPDGPNASPSPEESGSDQGFGATGVFQGLKTTEPAASSGVSPYFQEYRAPEAPKPLPTPGPKPLAEPVVHKVVFGAGAESSPELLDRMRLASAERAPHAEKAPAPDSGGKGSAGFTELLRTLESDLTSPVAAPREMPAPVRPAQQSGFTSLLRTLNSPEAAPTPAEVPIKAAQPPAQFARSIPEEPVRAQAASAPGGFTELLRTTTGGDPELNAPPMQRPGPGEAPVFGGTAGAIPAPIENKPGAFTQLFSTLGGGDASAPVPAASDRATGDSSRRDVGSFTRMLSLEPQSSAAEPAFREERKPLPGSVNYGLTPGMAGPTEPSRDPFAPPPLAEAKPVESTPSGAGVGITRLIQMLDEPSKPSAPRMEAAPVSPPRGTEPGVWTQTFASLSTPNAPAAPAANAPNWPSPPPQQPMSAAPTGREAQFPGSLSEPPVQPSAPSGPSEFTRILDASRMRELAMRGGSGAANLPQAPPPPPAMPSYPVPAAPPVGGMQGMGGMPHQGVYPPQQPQMPGYPMSYGPQAGAMPSPGGSLPQAPGMYAPAPPMPAAPPAPTPKPAEPGMGKLQQLVPLLLVVVIVLLVVLIVTVIFLMKH